MCFSIWFTRYGSHVPCFRSQCIPQIQSSTIRVYNVHSFGKLTGIATPKPISRQFHTTRQTLEDGTHHLKAAKQAYLETNYEKAIFHFDQILQLDPKLRLHAFLGKGSLLTNIGKPVEGIQCFDKGIAEDPNIAELHFYKGNALLQQGQYGKAKAAYERVIKLDPKHIQAHQNLGMVFMKQHKWEEAIEWFDKTTQLSPENGYAHSNKGSCYGELEEHEEAVACFQDALKYIPNDFETLYCLGVSLLNLENYEEALESFELALAQKEDDALSYLNKSYCQHMAGEDEDATLDLLMALKLDNNLRTTPTAIYLIKHYNIQ